MIYIIFAVICIAATFTLNKLYQLKFCKDTLGLLMFPIVLSLFSGLFYFCMNGFSLSFGWFTFLCALGYSLTGTFNNIAGLIIMKHCKMSLYMSFLMIGGMLIPFLFGIIFLNENLSVFRIIAMIILIVALFLPAFAKTDEKTSKIGIILCICVFLSNGMVSTISKFHQINVNALGTNDFALWSSIFSLILSGIIFCCLYHRRKENKTVTESINMENKAKGIRKYFPLLLLILISIISATGTLFNLSGAKIIDAAMLYPMITGGTIILTSLSGWLIYKEKANMFSIMGVVLALTGTILFAF